jgi:hypothetical protein
MTLKKLKEAVDRDRERAQVTRGRRRGMPFQRSQSKPQDGLSYETLERLATPVIEGLESSQDENEAKDLDAILDEMLQKEGLSSGAPSLNEFDELEEEEEEEDLDDEDEVDDDDDDDAELELDDVADAVRFDGSGGGGSGVKRAVIPARGFHEEVIQMGGVTPSKVSWSFKVESGDVGFVAAFRPEGDQKNDAGAISVVVPWTRCRSRREHTGQWQLTGDGCRGALTLRWDNSYSRVRSKAITFDVQK